MNKEEALRHALSLVDQEYIVRIRREIHEYPELEFDLPRTLAVVRRELDAMGISYTEKYGKSSIVAVLNPEKTAFTIGLRADMDALPLTEKTGLPFASKIDGQMHACGHDAHTAILLGTAKALVAVKDQLDCRVKLLFQACEEVRGGAEYMVRDGVMDDIDIILGLHVDNMIPTGSIGLCPGYAMASSTPIDVVFEGQSTHATRPQTGKDALAMAVKAYNDIQLMLTREMNPFDQFVCSVSALNAGFTHNIIADRAEMKISVRAYKTRVSDFIVERIKLLCSHAAEELGGKVTVSGEMSAYPVYNDPAITEKLRLAAIEIAGEACVKNIHPSMGSEDFSHFLTKKPGGYFLLGTRNEAKGCTKGVHNTDFIPDEDAFEVGSKVFIQFVFDNMKGVSGTEAVADQP
ncbi:MAG: amidohydrolase [Lachnospiraceae bacterium]|nr:amidohydrolase [Lachnospiraceae bacterium]